MRETHSLFRASAQSCCCRTIFSRCKQRCGLNLAVVTLWKRGWHFGLAYPIFGTEMKIYSGLHSQGYNNVGLHTSQKIKAYTFRGFIWLRCHLK